LFVATTGSLATGTVLYIEKRDQTFLREFNTTNATGVPKYFGNWDDFTIIVAPTPDSNYPVQLEYIKQPPHFTGY
jgi:hypothetical protein